MNKARAKLLILMGTRPEVIKLASLVHELKKEKTFEIRICFTAQHRDMCEPFLKFFSISPDYDLDVMTEDQSLSRIAMKTIERLDPVIKQFSPDALIVQGDTTSAFASSITAFYNKIQVLHVEAGLRSNSIEEPYPEEINRQLITRIASYHFAPTLRAKISLLKEGVSENRIFVTGNTVIDALEYALKRIPQEENKNSQKGEIKKVLITIHRRENLEMRLIELCKAINELVYRYRDIKILFPMHMNPVIRNTIRNKLAKSHRIELTDQLDYLSMVREITESFIVMSDSGGLQEEVPYLGKPIIVLRNVTERPEIIETGSAILGGTSRESITQAFDKIYNSRELRDRMSKKNKIYGDGKAAIRITEVIKSIFKGSDYLENNIESIKKEVEYTAS